MGNWLTEALPGKWGHFQSLLYSPLGVDHVCGITCAEPKADALSDAVFVAGDDLACRHYGAGCAVSCYPAGAIRSETSAGSIRRHQRHHHRADRGIGHIGSMAEQERPSRAQQRSFLACFIGLDFRVIAVPFSLPALSEPLNLFLWKLRSVAFPSRPLAACQRLPVHL